MAIILLFSRRDSARKKEPKVRVPEPFAHGGNGLIAPADVGRLVGLLKTMFNLLAHCRKGQPSSQLNTKCRDFKGAE
jgi:hypothetical protein